MECSRGKESLLEAPTSGGDGGVGNGGLGVGGVVMPGVDIQTTDLRGGCKYGWDDQRCGFLSTGMLRGVVVAVEAAAFSDGSGISSDAEPGKGVNVGHLGRLNLPVMQRVLDDTEGVDPDEGSAKLRGDQKRVLEGLRKDVEGDLGE